ncbi:VOC family protein [Streptomyces sp. NPDC085927]|uniref:VOC family protein n=1 Tax=Streptomyces sp. NPDC085927 TaxID=3365738 RepID=UPI0037CEE485
MARTQTLRGMATVTFFADDMDAATEWYTEFLGRPPYYEVLDDRGEPGYREFRLGDQEQELGLIHTRHAPGSPSGGPGGAVVFWHVDDVQGTLEKLMSMGAEVYEPLTERDEGFVTASVVDPFGNILGIMHNPHYLEILERSA